MAKYWHSGTVEVQDTSRHYGLRCSKHRWPKASLVVEAEGEAVTTAFSEKIALNGYWQSAVT